MALDEGDRVRLGTPDGVVDQLWSRFDGALPREVIDEVVRTAERDLRGQVSPLAMAEMVHRLAVYRLTELLGE